MSSPQRAAKARGEDLFWPGAYGGSDAQTTEGFGYVDFHRCLLLSLGWGNRS